MPIIFHDVQNELKYIFKSFNKKGANEVCKFLIDFIVAQTKH
jgi:hypothetical protein